VGTLVNFLYIVKFHFDLVYEYPIYQAGEYPVDQVFIKLQFYCIYLLIFNLFYCYIP